MSKKIVFIGAGSVVFTRNLVRDLLTYPAFADATIALVDINPKALALAKAAVDKIVEVGKYPAKVIATLERKEVLEGADGVITTIAVDNPEAMYADIAIPGEFGVSINVGDTRGPSGIFRFLRTMPDMVAIIKDIEIMCPDAIFLNYTNPMAMLCRMMQEIAPSVRTSGLCHSVQGTAKMLAGWIGADMADIDYVCAGVNHQAFYIDYKWKGKDAYPLLKEAIKKPEIFNEEQVRNEMFRHLDYYVTESSGHNSEYNAWFRKRPELIEEFCTHGTGWNPGHDLVARMKVHGDGWRVDRREVEFNKWIQGDIDLNRGLEYSASIFNAVFGDLTTFEFNGNVRNWNLIENLPYGCCVEVPVIANRRGLTPMHVGELPPQLSLLIDTTAQCEELAVQGAMEGDPRKIFQACLFDPLTAAVCSMQEIQNMVDKLFASQADCLPQFKHLT